MNAPLEIVWDLIQPQFQRAVLLFADVRREIAGLPWDMLPEGVRSDIAAALVRMGNSAAQREAAPLARTVKGLRG